MNELGGKLLGQKVTWKHDPRHDVAFWEPRGFHFESGAFDVPREMTPQAVADAVLKQGGELDRFGRFLESEGFQIDGTKGCADLLRRAWVEKHGITLEEDDSLVGRSVTEPDRRRFVMWAKVTRKPIVIKAWIPDEWAEGLVESDRLQITG